MKEEIKVIVRIVCRHFKIDEETLFKKTRKRDIVVPRQIVQAMTKKYVKASLAEIGRSTGWKDHATILYSVKTVGNLAETDRTYAQRLYKIEKEIRKTLMSFGNNMDMEDILFCLLRRGYDIRINANDYIGVDKNSIYLSGGAKIDLPISPETFYDIISC